MSTTQPDARATKYLVTASDGLFALAALVVGYLWWSWLWPREGPGGGTDSMTTYLPNVAVVAFFVVAFGVSVAYYRAQHVHLDAGAWTWAGATLTASLPFVLYTATPVHVLWGIVLLASFVLWHAHVSRTAQARSLDAGLIADALNQALCTPGRNAGAWWAGLTQLRGRGRARSVGVAVLGLIVAAPVIAGVIALLMSADPTFQLGASRVADALGRLNAFSVGWKVILGIPVAIGLFALWYAHSRQQRTTTITRSTLHRVARAVRRIQPLALAAPTAVLCLVYLVFFVAMGSYLFSGFAGVLPDGYTYADYARRGFLELAAVTVVNAAVIGFTAAMSRRTETGYPRSLRALGLVLSVETLALIAISASKMVLYVRAYGLTELRLYTLWYLAVALVAFVLVAVRHVRRFAMDRAVVITVLVGLLVLAFGNADGLVARYNVDGYLAGTQRTVDVSYLATGLSDAAVPQLARLADRAPDPAVAAQATQALQNAGHAECAAGIPWTAWNWQRHLARQAVGC